MPRHHRLCLPDVALHVIQRGNNRGNCFRSDADRRRFLGLLGAEARFMRVAIHAYVLMTNHFHVLATPSDKDGVPRMMQAVGQRYAQYFNRRHDRVGTLWQGRYRSCLVDTDAYFLTCQRYIENNPVRAGMVATPVEYAWSSYRANAEGAPDPLVTLHPVVAALGATPDERRRAYREFVNQPQQPELLDAIRDATNGGFVFGSRDLLAMVSERLSHPGVPGRPGRPRRGSGLVKK